MEVFHPSSYKYITIAKIRKDEVKKIDFDICKQPKETPDAYYKRVLKKPDVLTNAGFFSMTNGNTIFSVINETMVCSSNAGVNQGIGITGDNDVSFGKISDKKWRDFMSAYPPLIVDSKDAKSTLGKEIAYKARRTVFGYNDDYYFVICVDSPGMTFSQLKTLCLNLGCKYAVNFDGGGSTRMLVNGVRKTAVAYARPVDSVLAIYLKHENKKVNYQVKPIRTINIRLGPGTDFNVVGTIKSGIYTVIEEENENGTWGKLKSGAGWIYLPNTIRYVSGTSNTSTEYVITASVLNVRSGPGNKYKIITQKKKGTVINVTTLSRGWAKIPEGWVSQSYIKKK